MKSVEDFEKRHSIPYKAQLAFCSYDAIPKKFKDDLELHDVILHMADDIYRGEVTNI